MNLLAYVRISKDDDMDKLSPEVQLRLIYEWAAREGHTVTDVYEDRFLPTHAWEVGAQC